MNASDEEKDYEEEDIGPDAPQSDQQDLTDMEIDVREDPMTISDLVRKLDRGTMRRPAFQRRFVWKPEQQSAFIESLLLNYPLPPLYLNQNRDGMYLLIDGLQRTTTIHRFVKNEFALKGLKMLQSLEGMYFSKEEPGKNIPRLTPQIQTRLEDRKLNCYILKPSVPLATVQVIFTRINKGGTPLTFHEIRHAQLEGKGTDLLAQLADEHAEYGVWIGNRLQPDRMGDQEAALRCVSFAAVDPERDYRGNLNDFLTSALKRLGQPASVPQHPEIARQFDRIFRGMRSVLGENALRFPTTMTKGVLNVAMMETVYRVWAGHPDGWAARNAAALRANYAKLIVDTSFQAATRTATGTSSNVRNRFRLAKELLEVGCAD